MTDLRQQIAAALADFAGNKPLPDAAITLFSILGYRSERHLALPTAPHAFLSQFDRADNPLNRDRACVSEWQTIHLLFQLTDEDLTGERLLFARDNLDAALLKSYLFFAIRLRASEHPRGRLAAIARAVNRLFSIPVLILFSHGHKVSIAIINRRASKRDPGRDVLEKVSLIKDVSPANPHRGHVDVLASFALDELTRARAIRCFDDLHAAWSERLNIEVLNNRFYRRIQEWFFWAAKTVRFPHGNVENEDLRNRIALIRLLTRIVFSWFARQKGLIPPELFSPETARRVLKRFDPTDPAGGDYYLAILQNLFFPTLAVPLDQREFRNGRRYRGTNPHYMDHRFFRHEKLFRDPEGFGSLFEKIPFLNGGLFECLDTGACRADEVRVDGFSDEPRNQPLVPNVLFFGREVTVDLEEAYASEQKRDVKVDGLFHILDAYTFTVTENTPVEEEIALDPELLGRIFESLLAEYNLKTARTARKETGSFYTPRAIVDYMTSESLKAYLEQELVRRVPHCTHADAHAGLDVLFAYTEREHPFTPPEQRALVDAVYDVRVFDPACGSGAFPMGMLQKMVFILEKLDRDHRRWKDRIVADTPPAIREETRKLLERSTAEHNWKLGLIQHSIYGADIQPIAVQIAKLRCFISLLVDFQVDDRAENRGVPALPNLDFKFVATNSLIPAPGEHGARTDELGLREAFFDDFARAAEEYFYIRDPQKKRSLRDRIEALIATRIAAKEAELATSRGDGHTRADIRYALAERNKAAIRRAKNEKALWESYRNLFSFRNAPVNFFDTRYFFPEVKNGFNITIGNPPFLNVEVLTPEEKTVYQEHYTTFYKRYDVFGLFCEAALTRLSGPRGSVLFILPQQVANNLSYKKLRDLILDRKWLREVLYLGDRVFKAAHNDVCVLFLSKAGNDQIRLVNALDFDQRTTTMVPADHFRRYANVISFSGDARGERIIDSILSGDRWLLKDKFSVFQGIVTGNNGAFLPTQTEIENAGIEKALLHPVMLGRDFEKWAIRSTDRRIIYTNADTDIRKFPKTERWLRKFRPELEKRRECMKGIIPWFSLQWPRVQADLDRVPKILVQGTRNPRLKARIVATMDTDGVYGTQGVNFVVSREDGPSAFFLLGVLNSTPVNYLYSKKYLNVAIKAEYLKSTPIPRATDRAMGAIAKLVHCLLGAKARGNGTQAQFLEALIDACVMECYFPDHMAERDLLFLDDLVPHLGGYDPDTSETQQRNFLDHFYGTHNAPDSKIRNRLLRIAADSPDLLAVIKAEGRP